MDTLQHAYLPGLAIAIVGGSWEQMLIAGFIGAFPDIIGFIEKVVKWRWDETTWNWYNIAHSNSYRLLAAQLAIFGLLLALTVNPYWGAIMTAGFGGYAIHLTLDYETHGEGKRWWIWKERLPYEIVAWVILLLVTIVKYAI